MSNETNNTNASTQTRRTIKGLALVANQVPLSSQVVNDGKGGYLVDGQPLRPEVSKVMKEVEERGVEAITGKSLREQALMGPFSNLEEAFEASKDQGVALIVRNEQGNLRALTKGGKGLTVVDRCADGLVDEGGIYEGYTMTLGTQKFFIPVPSLKMPMAANEVGEFFGGLPRHFFKVAVAHAEANHEDNSLDFLKDGGKITLGF